MHTTLNGRKRVLLMVTKSNMGGAQKYIFDLATSLSKDQFEVTVAAGGHDLLFEKCEAQRIRIIKIPHLERDISLFKEFKAFWNVLKALRKEKPDIVHLNSPKMGGLGGLAARVTGIKNIIYTNHGWTFHEDRSWLMKKIIKFFSWIIVLLSTKTIVLSNREYKDAIQWPFVKNKLVIIPLGIKVPEFLEKVEARKKLFEMAGITDVQQELFLSIGELTKNKGYDYALLALKSYSKDFIYFIAGNGELQEQLKEKISEYELSSKVFLLGFVDKASQYMKGADIFLLPSIKEGMPYVLLEAGFAEIPVITTDVGGTEDLIHTDRKAVIRPKDSKALLRAMEQKNTVIINKNDIESMLTKTLELYK